eukprot:310829-Amphidinium_carterae.1
MNPFLIEIQNLGPFGGNDPSGSHVHFLRQAQGGILTAFNLCPSHQPSVPIQGVIPCVITAKRPEKSPIMENTCCSLHNTSPKKFSIAI